MKIVVVDYMTARELSKKWDITQRRVQVLYAQGKRHSAVLFRDTWAILKDAVKPIDGRYKKDSNVNKR